MTTGTAIIIIVIALFVFAFISTICELRQEQKDREKAGVKIKPLF